MSSVDDAPRIGDLEVDRDAITADGVTLAELADECASSIDATTAINAPIHGWRALHRYENGAVYLGSPLDDERRNWRVASVQPQELPPLVRVHPEVQPLRPSKLERRQGLELRWPSFIAEITDPSELAIDIVNSGSSRWWPEGDSFRAMGVLTRPGESEFSFGWVASGADRAVPLDPGEYARVAVQLQPLWEPATLQPGASDLHVVIVQLGLRLAEPLRVELTAEMIAREVANKSRHRADPEAERRAFDQQIEAERLLVRARRSWPQIADAIGSAVSDVEALERIAGVLGCTPEDAATVYDSPLRAMSRASIDRRESRLEDLIRERDALG